MGKLGCLSESFLNILTLQNKMKLSALFPVFWQVGPSLDKAEDQCAKQTGIMTK